MDTLTAAEARGDASNLKGTDYHLLFAIWLLVRNHADSVHFYAGNDLLATPIAPACERDGEDLFAPDRRRARKRSILFCASCKCPLDRCTYRCVVSRSACPISFATLNTSMPASIARVP